MYLLCTFLLGNTNSTGKDKEKVPEVWNNRMCFSIFNAELQQDFIKIYCICKHLSPAFLVQQTSTACQDSFYFQLNTCNKQIPSEQKRHFVLWFGFDRFSLVQGIFILYQLSALFNQGMRDRGMQASLYGWWESVKVISPFLVFTKPDLAFWMMMQQLFFQSIKE